MTPRHPDAPDSVLFARLVDARIGQGDLHLLGLDSPALGALIDRHFIDDASRDLANEIAAPQHPFFAELRGLLIWNDITKHAEDARCLASIIAAASLRPDHLWRDLGLSGRDDVTAMLERHYPQLIARNVENLRWKKFLAQEVAHAKGEAPTCAPGCPGCEDFGFCYPGVAPLLRN
jgi:nitrogen fixation protein NifQ